MAAAMPAMAESSPSAGNDAAAEWEAMAGDAEAQDAPVVDSPSISADWPAEGEASKAEDDWTTLVRDETQHAETVPQGRSWFRRLSSPPAAHSGKPSVSLTTACAAMGALVLALMIWRVDVVRLLPQTAAFYKMVGLDINLRGLMFKDVKITSETVEGKPVLKPGERAWFKSRLASPPPEGRNIDVRFFNRRDIAGGHI